MMSVGLRFCQLQICQFLHMPLSKDRHSLINHRPPFRGDVVISPLCPVPVQTGKLSFGMDRREGSCIRPFLHTGPCEVGWHPRHSVGPGEDQEEPKPVLCQGASTVQAIAKLSSSLGYQVAYTCLFFLLQIRLTTPPSALSSHWADGPL